MILHILKRMLCFWHKWEYGQDVLTDEHYKECRRCGKVRVITKEVI